MSIHGIFKDIMIRHETTNDIVKPSDAPLVLKSLDAMIRAIFNIHSNINTEYYHSKFNKEDSIDITYHLCCGLSDDDFALLDKMKTHTEYIRWINCDVCTMHTKIGKKVEVVRKRKGKRIKHIDQYESQPCMTLHFDIDLTKIKQEGI